MITRRSTLKLVAIGLVASPFDAVTAHRSYAVQEQSDDVPMFRGDAARTGEMPGPVPDPTHGVRERWRFHADGYVTSPAVVDSVVYVATEDAGVYALEAAPS